MPNPPSKPSPPFLFGATSQEKDASRASESLRLDWTPVAGATHHDIRFGATDIRPDAVRGTFLGGLAPDTLQSVTLRARNDDGDSPWSDPLDVATRPDRPAPPSLGTAADARGSDALLVTWPPATGAATYNIRVNGMELTSSVMPPLELATLPSGASLIPNTLYRIAVRSRDDAVGGTSDWSDEASFVTRPPTPTSPLRTPFDLFLFGLSVQWDLPTGFNGGTQSFIRLWRVTDGTGRVLLLDAGSEAGGRRRGRFTDLRYSPEVAKHYLLQLVVPRSAVPGDVLGDDNVSFDGPSIAIHRPIAIRLARPVLPTPVHPFSPDFRVGTLP